jgi:iron complex transport system substrate-binding protein
MMRIVSLLPAATEIIAALDAVDALVGVTHECDYPPAVATLPRVTWSAVDGAAPPDVVDRAVRETAVSGDPLFALDETLIATLAPDLIVTQGICEVCAVSEGDVRALAARLAPSPRVVSLDGSTLDGVLDDIGRVGSSLGAPDRAATLVEQLRARMRQVHETLAAAVAPRPRVAVLEWTDPLYAAGHWVPRMVRRAGGVDVLAAEGKHSQQISIDTVARAAPDVILVAPCGYDVERAAAEGRRLRESPRWAPLLAARAWAMDANALLSRPGPRLVDGIETLAAILHPTLFPAPSLDRAVALAG